MTPRQQWIIDSLQSKGYRIETEQSNNGKQKLFKVFHADYQNGLQHIASGLTTTQLKHFDICDSIGYARSVAHSKLID